MRGDNDDYDEGSYTSYHSNHDGPYERAYIESKPSYEDDSRFEDDNEEHFMDPARLAWGDQVSEASLSQHDNVEDPHTPLMVSNRPPRRPLQESLETSLHKVKSRLESLETSLHVNFKDVSESTHSRSRPQESFERIPQPYGSEPNTHIRQDASPGHRRSQSSRTQHDSPETSLHDMKRRSTHSLPSNPSNASRLTPPRSRSTRSSSPIPINPLSREQHPPQHEILQDSPETSLHDMKRRSTHSLPSNPSRLTPPRSRSTRSSSPIPINPLSREQHPPPHERFESHNVQHRSSMPNVPHESLESSYHAQRRSSMPNAKRNLSGSTHSRSRPPQVQHESLETSLHKVRHSSHRRSSMPILPPKYHCKPNESLETSLHNIKNRSASRAHNMAKVNSILGDDSLILQRDGSILYPGEDGGSFTHRDDNTITTCVNTMDEFVNEFGG
eukprot:CAMPEP_0194397876 /NCGR_PEP_ID=MMETSP0174-20130528/125788_1 /TAXON_ID=216777 /ORGANISM="Proboscia alata, Strain PI-D3" /LENGTH=442 /DNA_ID=CAMNT_0039194103 /DNA_START=141 /DNA_END=1466 /DNA_ORIENTATION=+